MQSDCTGLSPWERRLNAGAIQVFFRDFERKNKVKSVELLYLQEFDHFLHHSPFHCFFYCQWGCCQDATQHSNGSLSKKSVGEKKKMPNIYLYRQIYLKSFQIILVLQMAEQTRSHSNDKRRSLQKYNEEHL